MGRNRLIYCMADFAVVVAAANGSGGTFAGASEALRRRWVPVWAIPSDDSTSGVPTLFRLGASPIPDATHLDMEAMAVPSVISSVEPVSQAALLPLDLPHLPAIADPAQDNAEIAPGKVSNEGIVAQVGRPAPSSFEELFMTRWRDIGPEPATVDDLAAVLGLEKVQVKVWLARAVEHGKAIKLARPVRYQILLRPKGVN
jgi:predicted Rossmann fold nucleotide-binding protein DprA/Smf involved in DNA uptake